MTPRSLFEVALRILGIALLAVALMKIAEVGIYLGFGVYGNSPNIIASSLLTAGLSSLVQLIMGFCFIYFAPNVAAKFYAEEPAPVVPSSIGAGDLYHLVCFGLGIYFLISAALPLGLSFANLLQARDFGNVSGYLFAGTVYVAAGLMLLLGGKRLGEVITTLRYDPDTIPNQQVRLSFLLGLTIFFAILLGVLKMISG